MLMHKTNIYVSIYWYTFTKKCYINRYKYCKQNYTYLFKINKGIKRLNKFSEVMIADQMSETKDKCRFLPPKFENTASVLQVLYLVWCRMSPLPLYDINKIFVQYVLNGCHYMKLSVVPISWGSILIKWSVFELD